MPGLPTLAQQRQPARSRPSPIQSTRSASALTPWPDLQHAPVDEPSAVKDPFGYMFTFAAESPKLDPLGESILSDADNKELDNFFTNMAESSINLADSATNSDFLSIPPEYMASTTSYDPRPPATSASESRGLSSLSMYGLGSLDADGLPQLQRQPQQPLLHSPQHQLVLAPSPAPEPTREDLAAAAFLHTGAAGLRAPHTSTFENINSRLAPATNAGRAAPLPRHQNMQEFQQEAWRGDRRHAAAAADNADYKPSADAHMFWNPSKRIARPLFGYPPAPQWGSDRSFADNMLPFVPPSNKEPLEALGSMPVNPFSTLYPRQPVVCPYSSSSSPTSTEFPAIALAHSRTSSQALHLNLDLEAPSTKRQKSMSITHDLRKGLGALKTTKANNAKSEIPEVPSPTTPGTSNNNNNNNDNDNNDDNDNDDNDNDDNKASKRRKSESASATDGTPPKATSKRRKSTSTPAAVNNSASKRMNLTNEQKRENHNNSEKRRRGVIQDGFQGIQDLVPGLSDGGYSKFLKLKMTADYTEDLVAENTRLWKQRDELRAQQGLPPLAQVEENYNNSRSA